MHGRLGTLCWHLGKASGWVRLGRTRGFYWKLKRDALFGERYGFSKVRHIGPWILGKVRPL